MVSNLIQAEVVGDYNEGGNGLFRESGLSQNGYRDAGLGKKTPGKSGWTTDGRFQICLMGNVILPLKTIRDRVITMYHSKNKTASI